METLIIEEEIDNGDGKVRYAAPVETSSKKYLKKIIKDRVAEAEKYDEKVFPVGELKNDIWIHTCHRTTIFTIEDWIKKRKIVEIN